MYQVTFSEQAMRELNKLDKLTQLDAISLAAWSELAAGDASQAREAFQALVENRPDDVAAWEGLRAT